MHPTGTQASHKRQQIQFPFKKSGGNRKQRQSDSLQIKARLKKRCSVPSFFSRCGSMLAVRQGSRQEKAHGDWKTGDDFRSHGRQECLGPGNS